MNAKKITLYAADATNGGAYADAGATLVVGDAFDQIGGDRAQAAVDAGRAASVTAAKADEKAA